MKSVTVLLLRGEPGSDSSRFSQKLLYGTVKDLAELVRKLC